MSEGVEAEMPAIKYRVDLTDGERMQLQALTHKGTSGAAARPEYAFC